MSDFLKHECGIAMIRLLKPIDYYKEKYGSALYGFNQLFLLMEKQHNRGQDGAGVGCFKLDTPVGHPYIYLGNGAYKLILFACIFNQLLTDYNQQVDAGIIFPEFPNSVKENFFFWGEILARSFKIWNIWCIHSKKNVIPLLGSLIGPLKV